MLYRFLDKAISKVYPYYFKLEDKFEALNIQKDNCEAILISLADELEKPKIVKNNDNVFQIMFPTNDFEGELHDKKALFLFVASKIESGIMQCPSLSEDDKETVSALLKDWKSGCLSEIE